jgi:hypothetical protein
VTTALLTTAEETVSIEIGGMAIALRTQNPSFRRLIENRYAGFVGTSPSFYISPYGDVFPVCSSRSPAAMCVDRNSSTSGAILRS